MKTILNISAYRFVELADTASLRDRLDHQAGELGLKGTILLAEEGINLFLAGAEAPVRRFLAWLELDTRFAQLEAKESWSSTVPFRKLLVKVKREIIRMNHPAIRPEGGRAPAVDAATLARWLDTGRDDDGREIVMLDTRNAFEVEIGRFAGALDWELERFSEFPEALETHKQSLAGKTIVTYCTGGIRCEKAALLMSEAGVQNVLQLDGGVLRYFEHVGDRHFEGACFVFDSRRSLDASLDGPACSSHTATTSASA